MLRRAARATATGIDPHVGVDWLKTIDGCRSFGPKVDRLVHDFGREIEDFRIRHCTASISRPLTVSDIDVLRRWISAGARTLRPEPETIGDGHVLSPEDRAFWSLQPVTRYEVPAAPGASPDESPKVRTRDAIDAFLVAAMPAGLSPLNVQPAKRTGPLQSRTLTASANVPFTVRPEISVVLPTL